MNTTDIAAQLATCTTREQVCDILSPLRVPQLREVATTYGRYGIPLTARGSKSSLIDQMVSYIGMRLSYRAIQGN